MGGPSSYMRERIRRQRENARWLDITLRNPDGVKKLRVGRDHGPRLGGQWVKAYPRSRKLVIERFLAHHRRLVAGLLRRQQPRTLGVGRHMTGAVLKTTPPPTVKMAQLTITHDVGHQ
ncbi:hypothetical protein Pan189_12620 [Stratiformator vulcanicus]|uniref:Uncharacterized protein n=1 Tax=Stratiformator vulcanicus TaxID=2527980 RepID=A0A517QZ66_9PLAN|nr:hypothetical protein Pan189_12620 [Stratiformator vulcanicus]